VKKTVTELQQLKNNLTSNKRIIDGAEIILNHFLEPIFPRTISTRNSNGKQFMVFSRDQIINAYQESNFIDCRVNAYPSYVEYKGIQRFPPNFIFADLDQSLFRSKKSLNRALSTSLRTIRSELGGNPTVLWTGNGYHIYQPMEAQILEDLVQFDQFQKPSLSFLRFAENYLTNSKSDPSHNPSFKSCMIRIPGSLNSKYPQGKDEVKIIQTWDGNRPSINLLLVNFHATLVNEKISELNDKKSINRRFRTPTNGNNSIPWIETLFHTPLEDYRKNAIALILAPYLINIKRLSYEASFQMINAWLKGCNELRALGFGISGKINYSLSIAIRKNQLPMKFSTLKAKNQALYTILKCKMRNNY
jgi:hypothetical protein